LKCDSSSPPTYHENNISSSFRAPTDELCQEATDAHDIDVQPSLRPGCISVAKENPRRCCFELEIVNTSKIVPKNGENAKLIVPDNKSV
jgi:hypothetical protein